MADIIIVSSLLLSQFCDQTDKETYAWGKSLLWRRIGYCKESKEKQFRWSVMGTKTMKIKGMTCEHCVNNVTNAINKVAGASAKSIFKR